ncbi:sugar ABC transporter substrate-binding protein [Ancrocorticia populi]|uniref:Maltose ABC transporter substrate-binding protein n=1 Tax=Ancrocorticia populi TaxID=2175228 RepID=A0A2V1JZE3_9ACTO|nr:extracellular solute-binding protein [Ancrocorticia populi]PWF24384.1 maltose ABC transporter substrate-binding protein [Ancrocorticia populi]
MRRGIALAAVASMAFTLAACGGNDDSGSTDSATEGVSAAPAGDGNLTVWTDSNREPALKEAAAAYEEETGNKVELVVKDFDGIRADFLSQVSNGEGPDITVGAHDWLGEFAANGVVSPIELGDGAADFAEVSISAFTYDGQVYGLPYAIENTAIIRNTALADSTPESFDDMIAMGEEAGTDYSFLVQTGAEGDPYTFYPFQTSFGAPVFEQNSDGSYTSDLALGGENGQAYAQWLAEQGQAGVLDTAIDYDIAVDAFKNGESPYILGGPWMIADFEDAGIDVAVDPIPSAGGETAVPFSGVQGFYMSSASDNQLLASQFLIDYVGTKDVQFSIYETGNRLPALTAAAEEASQDDATAGFAEVAEVAQPMPSTPEMGEVWAFWGVTEAQIISGDASDPVAAWDKMVDDIQAAIDASN